MRSQPIWPSSCCTASGCCTAIFACLAYGQTAQWPTGRARVCAPSGYSDRLASLPDGRYLIEYQYRHPVGRAMLEFPAGKIDAGEPSLASAQRELREETGFVAGQWAFAGVMHNCIGYSDEHIDIWFARDLQFQGQALDDGGSFAGMPHRCQICCNAHAAAELTDAKTLTALLWLQQVHAGQWRWLVRVRSQGLSVCSMRAHSRLREQSIHLLCDFRLRIRAIAGNGVALGHAA